MSEDHERLEEGDDVARLLRLAGKRLPVPAERATRVRAAVWAEWQKALRRRSRARYLGAAAGLAAAASLAAIALRYSSVGRGLEPGADPLIRVEALAGAAWSRDAVSGHVRAAREVRVGDRVHLGSELQTDAESRAAIRLASGHSVRLDASTSVRWLDGRSLALDRGALYVDSMPGETPGGDSEPGHAPGEDSGAGAAAAGPIEVHTPFGVVRERGTQFEVRLEDDAVLLRLREGEAAVERGGPPQVVKAGSELRVMRDGSVLRRSVATDGPEWAWISGITPMPDLEGRSARSFLDWVARERGLRLAFSDPEVARSAGEIVLGGTVERLTPSQALDAVLPSCRMTYRIEGGVLRIAAAAR